MSGLLFFVACISAANAKLPAQNASGATLPVNICNSSTAQFSFYDTLPGDTLASIPAPAESIMGITWVKDTLFVLKQHSNPDSNATLYKVNPLNGIILSQFTLPFTGWVLGIAFDNINLWIVKSSPTQVIYHITTNGTLIDSFLAPCPYPRGIAWDGKYLWIGNAQDGLLYQIDTLANVIRTVAMKEAISWCMGMVWVPQHFDGHLWVNDYIGNDINQLDVSGDTALLIQHFPHPGTCIEGITHDGENLWVSDYKIAILWKLHDGISETNIEESSSPIQTASLIQIRPNPFSRFSAIQYFIPHRASVKLAIHNINGQPIRTLLNNTVFPGHYTILWDGKDDNGGTLPNGIFFCQLKYSGIKETQKVLLLK